ncbi:OmpA family protein [Pleionea sediminis]|uniref:OmpA family protein n=1 Tax=Pleionea sediminis TaxID=2569479 RepID=UPI0013DDD72E|nr:OmpA family protein [Pleionea sediminis]
MKLNLPLLMIASAIALTGCSSMSTQESTASVETEAPVEETVIVETPTAPDHHLLFAFDSYELSFSQESTLNEWIDYLQESGASDISIHGHADEVGSEMYNYELSKKRAQTIQQALTEKLGRNVSVEIFAYGETMPLVEGSTDSERQLNRRVEIKVSEFDTSLAMKQQ